MEKDTNYAPIMSLPSEIINMIFQNIHYTDIIKFGLTCKHFNELVSNNQYLWKEKVKNFLPNDVFSLIESRSDGNWFGIFKSFYKVKKQVYHEIIAMSAKYFSRVDEIKLEDVRMFFNLALADNLNYYYVTYILQDVIKQAYKGTENNNCKKPFTLTEVFYAKAVLRYLVQTFLTVKWVQAHLKKELYPEIVLNFFTQWMDPLHFHLEEDVEEAINSVVDNVNALLPTDEHSPEQLTIPEKINKGIVTQKQVLHVISQVLYQQMRMATMTQANLDTLDIKKVINNKCGNAIAAAVVYYSIAMKCGVHCELIAFPHHLILQWQNVYDTHPQLQYKIVLDTGELIPKGRCPFSNNLFGSAYKYCPDSLLQYIVSAFLMTKGLIKDWYTQNSSYLLDFLSTNPSQENPYRNFLPYLLDNTHLSALSDPIDIKAMSDAHIEIIQALSYLNPSPPALCREITVKHRDSNVKYAIGMLCYHKKYDYMCVIRGWSLCCAEKQGFADLKTLRMGGEQPFYNVIAVDQSSRYVAQENITEIGRPTRVYHLEDVIAKEFTHFDGFCYVPNSEKEKEYPEDAPIREIFRARAELRA